MTPDADLIEARYDARTRLTALRDEAQAISKELTEVMEGLDVGAWNEFKCARDLSDSAWRAATHAVAIFE